MKLDNAAGVSPKDARRLALEELRQSLLIRGLPEREPMVQRSMMSDEEQIASPESGLSEDEFLPYPGAYGQVDVMPMLGALTPAQRAAKAGYKKAVRNIEESATGAFDKIKKMLGIEMEVRDPQERRAIWQSHIGNKYSHELPINFEQKQALIRQKALQDTRQALKNRAERVAAGSSLPEGGYFFGIEPLDDTIVKGASLHKSFDLFDEGEVPKAGEILQNYDTKKKAQVAAKFGAGFPYGRREVLEAIELDARKRGAADDFLARKGLAPESMVVRTPGNTYMVQDRASKSLSDLKMDAYSKTHQEVNLINGAIQNGEINPESGDKAIKELWKKYFAFERELDTRLDVMRDRIKESGLYPSDLHKGNVMVNKSGADVVVDTQDFYRRAPQDKWGNDEVKLEPLPKDHWRVIRKPR